VLRNALIVALILSCSSAFAGPSTSIVISGKVWSIDEDSLIIQDASKKFWKIPRRILKRKMEISPDQKITVQVQRKDAQPYQARNQ
jgi:hypothetical protein